MITETIKRELAWQKGALRKLLEETKDDPLFQLHIFGSIIGEFPGELCIVGEFYEITIKVHQIQKAEKEYYRLMAILLGKARETKEELDITKIHKEE